MGNPNPLDRINTTDIASKTEKIIFLFNIIEVMPVPTVPATFSPRVKAPIIAKTAPMDTHCKCVNLREPATGAKVSSLAPIPIASMNAINKNGDSKMRSIKFTTFIL